MATPYSIAFVTAPDRAAADRLAQGLVGGRLAACVSVLPKAVSTYRWKGKVEKASEALLVIKTRTALMKAVCGFVSKNHPYSVPEVISWPIAHGAALYLKWLKAETS
ncbi:MAG: divalent-cation tolerance protein CutA [Elusimicrobia bacterium]|nr:divalent-cation tolerance protein CutA [Elusimicrobiota bacterium]